MNEVVNQGDVKQFWDPFFESDVRLWVEWHDFWLEKIRQKKVPVFFFRFEDLLM